jgi:hypothetical protein
VNFSLGLRRYDCDTLAHQVRAYSRRRSSSRGTT